MWNDYVVEGYPKKNQIRPQYDRAIMSLRETAHDLISIANGLIGENKKFHLAMALEHEDAARILENISKLKKFTRPMFGEVGTRDVDVAEQIKIWQSIFGYETCDLCDGESGAVPGNGNIINGQVVCDYCSVNMSKEP